MNPLRQHQCHRLIGPRVFFSVEIYDRADGSLRMHVEEGLLSAQSTPLVTRSGKPIGMVSTHWRNHHRPTERELRFLDLLARQAADLIELRQAQERIRKSEAHLAAELEERVRERTRELAEANVSLRSEVTERRLGEQRIKKLLRQVVNAQEATIAEFRKAVADLRNKPQ